MTRYLLIGSVLIAAMLATAILLSFFNRPTETDYRLARGRAQLYTENYLAALQTLRDISNSQKAGPQAHSYLGAAYLKLHLYKAAIEEFEEAIKERPRGSDAWITLGRAQWLQRNLDEAEKAALKAREIDPGNAAATDLVLHIYFDFDQPSKFQAELDRARTTTKPIKDLAVRFFLRQGQFARAYDAQIRYERNAVERAILENQLALEREPSRTDLVPELVKNLVKVSRFEGAIDAARKYKGAAVSDLEIGKAYWMLGRKDDAIQAYRRSSAARVHKLSAEVSLAAITGDTKHWQEAYRAERVETDYFILARLEDLLPKAEPLVRAFIYRYAAIYDGSFYNRAAEEALKVLNDDSHNFDALMTIGTAYKRLTRIDDARRYIELARDLYPKSGEPPSRLASLALASEPKDPRTILGFMETAVKLEPDHAGYVYNLAWLYDQLGQTSKAAELYQRAIKQSPLTFEAMNNLALIYSNSGQADRALPLLEQAMRTDPENEAVYANAANFYVHQHAWKQALENYDRA